MELDYKKILHIASFSPGSLEFPGGWVGHLPFASWLMTELAPIFFVELGTHSGNSYFTFCQTVKEHLLATKCYAVDTWKGEDHAGFYEEDLFIRVNNHNQNHFSSFSTLLRTTFDDATSYFSDQTIDLLHIDGLHTYKAVKHDFENWLPKLSPGAVVLFHDIVVRDRGFGVWKLWEELKQKFPNYLEFKHSNGLGVLQVSGDGDKFHHWLLPDCPDQKLLIDYFTGLGQKQLEQYALNESIDKITALKTDNARLIQQVQTIERALAEQETQLATVYASTSWRLTAPMRSVVIFTRKIKHASRIIWRLIRQRSLKELIFRVVLICHHEGLSGLGVRIRNQNLVQYGDQGFSSYFKMSGKYVYSEPKIPADFREQMNVMGQHPLFSIVVPVYNTNPDIFKAMFDSVCSQWYSHWELILVDDASPDPEIRNFLEKIDHPQVQVIFSEVNRGISGATNIALEAASGEFVVFLDHDDELTVDCLFELAICINRDQPDFIYSDEDKKEADGECKDPFFKPDWAPDTLMSIMYTCHVSCVRKSLINEIGGLRSEFDGSQDWDFILRYTEKTKNISHIPKVLYHWRISPQSVASGIGAKEYALKTMCLVREAALKRRGMAGSIEPIAHTPGFFRVNYHLMGTPKISIIIPTKDNTKILRQCLDSIQKNSHYRRFEVIILDNGSKTQEALGYFHEIEQKYGYSVIRHDEPFNFSRLCNIGANAAKGDLLLFLNDDTELISADWLERMGGYAQLSHIGAVGAKLIYPGGQFIQHAGVINLAIGPSHAFLRAPADSPMDFMRNLLEYNWIAVTGACLMIEKKKFGKIGGFDEKFPVAYNDIELCFRLVKQGYFNVVCQHVKLIHHESLSRGDDSIDIEKRKRLQRDLKELYAKHPYFYQHDPFYNPNLHPGSLFFEIRGGR